ncbi:MAG: DUF429 domain-containing protein [Kofleriaceae bacterium]
MARSRMRTPMVIGVDACASGWVVVGCTDGLYDVRVHATFERVLAANPGARCIAVDMPVGFLSRGWRAADDAARSYLRGSGRTSSVFAAPPRLALSAPTHERACALTKKHCGKGITKQSFALFPKIREVDRHVDDTRIIEVHPEICFRALAGPHVAIASKHTWAGVMTRRALLTKAGIQLPASFVGDHEVGVDDVLDAAVVTWTAQRFVNKQAQSLPPMSTEKDACGRTLRIVV